MLTVIRVKVNQNREFSPSDEKKLCATTESDMFQNVHFLLSNSQNFFHSHTGLELTYQTVKSKSQLKILTRDTSLRAAANGFCEGAKMYSRTTCVFKMNKQGVCRATTPVTISVK